MKILPQVKWQISAFMLHCFTPRGQVNKALEYYIYLHVYLHVRYTEVNAINKTDLQFPDTNDQICT